MAGIYNGERLEPFLAQSEGSGTPCNRLEGPHRPGAP